MHTLLNRLHTVSSNFQTIPRIFPETSGKWRGRQRGAGPGGATGGDWVLCAHLSLALPGTPHMASTRKTCSKHQLGQSCAHNRTEASGRCRDRAGPQLTRPTRRIPEGASRNSACFLKMLAPCLRTNVKVQHLRLARTAVRRFHLAWRSASPGRASPEPTLKRGARMVASRGEKRLCRLTWLLGGL